MDRHAEILAVLQGRVLAASKAQALIDHRAAAKRFGRSFSNVSLPDASQTSLDVNLLMRPTVEQVDEQWARSLVKKGLSLDLVDDPEFRKAVLMLTRAGPVSVNYNLILIKFNFN